MSVSRRLLVVAILLGAAPASAAGPGTELTVEIVGLRSDRGVVLVSLFNSPDGYPERPERAVARAIGQIKDGRSTVKLGDLQPGTYALAAIHDENNNRKLDKNWLGIPKEGVGASNDARGKRGPPSFQAASFRLGPGRTVQRLRMQYR